MKSFVSKKNFVMIACACAAGLLNAFTPKFAGYCGNSGTEAEPVVFGKFLKGNPHGQQTQCGPYYDKETGLIYASAGSDRINAYTVDGRMAASYPIPKGYFKHSGDPLVCEGGNLYFRRNGAMWQLALNATNGTSAVKANCKFNKIALISSCAHNGEIVLWLEDKTLHLWNVNSGESRQIGLIEEQHVNSIVFNSKGELYAFSFDKVYKIVDGKVLASGGWPKKLIGRGIPIMNCRRTGGAFFTTSYAGGVIRINEETLELEPGVVFGGSGGHTLAYVFFDNDISIGGGVEYLGGDYYVVLGQFGSLTVMKYDVKSDKFVRVRRIGALPENKVLNLSEDGAILCGSVVWRWNESENAPTHSSRSYSGASVSERVGNEVLTLGTWYVWPGILVGAFEEVGPRPSMRKKGLAKFSDKSVGAACAGKRKLYVLNGNGASYKYDFWYDKHRMNLNDEKDVELKLSKPGVKFTGMTRMRDDLFVMACDGEIVLVKPEDEKLTEVKRFAQTFDRDCKIAADDKHILVSEKAENCVTVLDEFGKVLHRFDVTAPGAVAINGRRLIIHDTNSQRILKYEISQ